MSTVAKVQTYPAMLKMRTASSHGAFRPMHRRMEDTIRQLCEQATAEEDPAKLSHILVELRGAIHQHIGRLRTKLATYPVGVERRDRKPGMDSGNS